MNIAHNFKINFNFFLHVYSFDKKEFNSMFLGLEEKKTLHRKLQIEQHELLEVNSRAQEG